METAQSLTPEQRRQIVRDEYRRAISNLTPNCPGGRYSGQQIASAKGIARRRALEIIDAHDRAVA